MAALGPYSRQGILSKPDGRTREARLIASLRAELIAHVGGKPSITQRMLIDQACELQLRIALMDRRFTETGSQTDHDSRHYLAWTNSLSRLLRQLGMKGAAQRQLTPTEIMRGAAA